MRSFSWLCACAFLAASAPAALHGQQPTPATISQEGTYRLSVLDEEPVLRNGRDVSRTIERLYPPELRAAGAEAQVMVKYRIIESGRVDTASIQVVSTTDARFDAVAKQVVARMVFAPGVLNGRPVKVWAEQALNFRLPAAAPAP
ncbi:MAG TPA: energy transducer TonB [Longimicrobium sp.]|nr:energy transducer TonB [Longimicrobium sp.]